MKEKLQRVRDKGYIGPGPVQSLTAFFHVPKGEEDIRKGKGYSNEEVKAHFKQKMNG